MMMMAELIQGQASVAQPGTKDDFADTIRRVRQVKRCPADTSVMLFRPLTARFTGGAGRGLGRGKNLAEHYKHSSCTLRANWLTLSSRSSIADRTD